MIRFSDKKLFLKGTAEAILIDKATGNIRYYSNKFQTANVQTSVTMGEIRGGLGNAIVAMLPSDAGLTVEFNAADFSLEAKAMQAGAALTFGAPVMVCQSVTATGASLTIDVSEGTPVQALGMSGIYAWVQEIGSTSLIAQDGTAYTLDPLTGTVSGFSAVSGKSYKVTYFVNRENAQVATITTAIDPFIGYFMAAMAVYSNSGSAVNEGTREGTLYVIVPSLKFGGNAGANGDQTTPDTTSLSGQAIAYDDDTVTESCDECAGAGNPLAYYVYVPCDTTSGIEALALIGGVISVAPGGTAQADFRLVMQGNSLAVPDPAFMSYEMTTAITGVSVSATGLITATAEAAGDGELTATYTNGGVTFKVPANVTVTAA